MKIYVDLDHVDITEYTGIESGEYNTNKINFIFTPEYKDLVKVAIFGCKLDTEEPKFYKLYLTDDSCYIPPEVLEISDVITIGCYGYKASGETLNLRYSPTPVKVIVYEGSFREGAENSSPLTPTEVEQIMSRIATLDDEVDDLDGRVTVLEGKSCDLDGLKSDVDRLKTDVNDLDSRLDEVEGDIADTYSKEEVNTLLGAKVDTTTYNSGQAAQDNRIQDLETIISQWPTVTDTGTGITLNPTIQYKMDLELKGNSSQNGTPTPESPVNINVVTGENSIVICGKNLLNFSILESGGINTTTGLNEGGATYIRTSDYIQVVPSSTFGIQYSSEAVSPQIIVYRYDKDKNFISYSSISSLSGTKSIADNIYYIKLRFRSTSNDTSTISNVQVEYGSSVSAYEPYKSQTYPVSLGTLKLYKISDYQDYIYYNEGKWYKYSAIKKGTITSVDSVGTASSGINYADMGTVSDTVTNGTILCNKYITTNNAQNDNSIRFATKRLYVYDNTFTTKEIAETSLIGLEYFYPLATPISTEITDDSLISQLNNIRNAYSFNPTTNIVQTNAGDPFIITGSALKRFI